MNLATIINGIGGFAGGLSNALQQQQGQSELGDALSALYGGGQSGGGSSSMGGGSSQPAMIPMISGSGQGEGGQYQGQTNLGLPTAAGGGMGAGPLASQLGATQPMTARPFPASMQGGNYGYAAPQGQQQGQDVGSPVGAAQQSQGPQVGGGGASRPQFGGGPLTLPSLVAAIKQRNPNISGVHLARAVERAIPLLNMEGLQQYRQLGLQLREEQMKNLEADRADRSADRKQGMKDRLQMANDRIQEQNARHAEDVQIKLKGLQQAKDLKEARGYAQDLRAAIKDKLEATNHQIQMQYNLTDDQRADLYKQAQDDAKRANDQLDQLLAQKGKGGKAGGATSGENNQKDNQGAQAAKPKISDEQKATYKKQAQETMAQHPEWTDKIRAKYKELTGDNLGD